MTFIQRLQQVYDAHKFLGLNLSVNAEQFRVCNAHEKLV